MFESTAQAIAALQNTRLPESQRVDAAHFLEAGPTSESITALVDALSDNDHGVRWAAGAALAHIGEPAMPALLNALVAPDISKALRDGAHHVLAENSSPRVRELSVPLIKALKGPQAGIATMQEALKLMPTFG